MNIAALFTCFNRRVKTEQCIRTLVGSNPSCSFSFVVADDNSTDGTQEMLNEMSKNLSINKLEGDGRLFYSGGMRLTMDYVLNTLKDEYDYVLIINDDVEFIGNCIEKMAVQSSVNGNAIIVGTICGKNGELTYGAVKFMKGIKYYVLSIDESSVKADTFNANCVLIPKDAFKNTGSMDKHYLHSLGDFDYGLSLKRNGYVMYPTSYYVGVCERNSIKNSWMDKKLSIVERIKKKESIKGAPTRQWYYYLKKNYGISAALRGIITPYIRILLRI